MAGELDADALVAALREEGERQREAQRRARSMQARSFFTSGEDGDSGDGEEEAAAARVDEARLRATLCTDYHEFGLCERGDACPYAHNDDAVPLETDSTLLNTVKEVLRGAGPAEEGAEGGGAAADARPAHDGRAGSSSGAAPSHTAPSSSSEQSTRKRPRDACGGADASARSTAAKLSFAEEDRLRLARLRRDTAPPEGPPVVAKEWVESLVDVPAGQLPKYEYDPRHKLPRNVRQRCLEKLVSVQLPCRPAELRGIVLRAIATMDTLAAKCKMPSTFRNMVTNEARRLKKECAAARTAAK